MAGATPETVAAELESFIPARDEAENLCRLYALFDGFENMSGRKIALDAMFSLLERFPDGEFGSPGPLVREIQRIHGYEEKLRASLARIPTRHTIWMVNMILNATSEESMWCAWMDELRKARVHPLVSKHLSERAGDYITYQNKRIEE